MSSSSLMPRNAPSVLIGVVAWLSGLIRTAHPCIEENENLKGRLIAEVLDCSDASCIASAGRPEAGPRRQRPR